MTLRDVFVGESTRASELVQKGTLLLLTLALAAGLFLAFRRQRGILLGVAMALLFVFIPAVYVLAQRMAARARQRATDERIVRQTRTYLLNWESHYVSGAVASCETAGADAGGAKLLPAVAGKGLSSRGFRDIEGRPSSPPAGALAVHGAMPRRHAPRKFCLQMPHPVRLTLSELVPAADRN